MKLSRTMLGVLVCGLLAATPLSVVHAQTYYPGNTGNWWSGWEQYMPWEHHNYYVYSYPTPQCTLSITTPNTYNSYGVEATLTWNASNASSAYLSEVGNVNPSWGSASVYAYPGETFTMTVSNPSGSRTCQTEYTSYQYYQPYQYNSGYEYGYGYGSGYSYGSAYSNYNPYQMYNYTY